MLKQFSGRRINGSVYVADALDLLRHVKTESVSLLFLDPPFNLGKKYGGQRGLDKKSKINYETWMQGILDECVRVLEPGGALFLYHVPAWAIRFGGYLQSNLEFRHWIAVSMKNGFVRGKRLYPAHYALLYFTRDDPKYFRRPKTKPTRCRHCNGLLKDYGGYLPIIKKKGVNLSDFWEDLSPVRHSSKKNRAANELPAALSERIMAIASRRGKLFCDPFVGAGSAVLSAARSGMKFIAGDIVEDNARITIARMTTLCNQVSKRRSIGHARQS